MAGSCNQAERIPCRGIEHPHAMGLRHDLSLLTIGLASEATLHGWQHRFAHSPTRRFVPS